MISSFLSYRKLILGQPEKVLYLLMSGPTQRPKAKPFKPAESVTPGRMALTAVNQPQSESPAGAEEKRSTEMAVTAGSTVGQLKQLLTLPSARTSDGVSELRDQLIGNPKSLLVKEMLPVSESVPEDGMRDEKSKSE